MRTYFADIEDMGDKSSFLYHQDFDTDEQAIAHFRRVFGDRVEMISIKGRDKFISVYEKPDLFPYAEDIVPVNYRNLLKKYMNFIVVEEGISYLDKVDEYSRSITSRELEELLTIDNEIQE
jgi:hypothetical protein